jgi:hypothetical protein
MNRHDAKTEPSGLDEEQARVLDDMEPVASTTRQLGFMRSQGIATADLKGDFADDINDMFSCHRPQRLITPLFHASTEPA